MSTPTATPRTDAEEKLAREKYESLREAGDPNFDDSPYFHARILETELATAKAECERLKFATEGHLLKTIQQQAELARLRADNLTAHQMACAAGLERDQLRAELKELSQAYELNRVSIDELDADRARAERAEVERDALAKDKARLDWLSVSDAWFDYPATGAFTPDTMRAAIDAAMKP